MSWIQERNNWESANATLKNTKKATYLISKKHIPVDCTGNKADRIYDNSAHEELGTQP